MPANMEMIENNPQKTKQTKASSGRGVKVAEAAGGGTDGQTFLRGISKKLTK